MEKHGSQTRESFQEAGYKILHGPFKDGSVVLWNIENKCQEAWQEHDDYSGYVIVINNIGYEFLMSIRNGE